MSISPRQTTANSCKTAFSLHVVESASDDYNFWLCIVVVWSLIIFDMDSDVKLKISNLSYLALDEIAFVSRPAAELRQTHLDNSSMLISDND